MSQAFFRIRAAGCSGAGSIVPASTGHHRRLATTSPRSDLRNLRMIFSEKCAVHRHIGSVAIGRVLNLLDLHALQKILAV